MVLARRRAERAAGIVTRRKHPARSWIVAGRAAEAQRRREVALLQQRGEQRAVWEGQGVGQQQEEEEEGEDDDEEEEEEEEEVEGDEGDDDKEDDEEEEEGIGARGIQGAAPPAMPVERRSIFSGRPGVNDMSFADCAKVVMKERRESMLRHGEYIAAGGRDYSQRRGRRYHY